MENNDKQELYDLLVTRNLDPEILGKDGKPAGPDDAVMYKFDWKTEANNYGTVVILMTDEQELVVFFGDNVGRSMEAGDKQEWYKFLEQLKMFASRNMLNFTLNDISRLKYTMQGLSAIKEGLFEGYYGKKRVSYSDPPSKTRLMIKHTRDLGEDEARYRSIESIFVETSDGERFKVPSRSLAHGKMLARHVSEGGNPYDTFGQHITKMVNEINTLARFIRASKGRQFSGETDGLIEAAVRHYGELKDKAKKIISKRGYYEELDNFDPAKIEDSETTVESIRDLFVERNIDQRIEEALPILVHLSKKHKESDMKEINEFEQWTNQVMEGTWALPETPEDMAKLKQLMSKDLVVGVDAMDATEQLYDLVGDDQLFDILANLAEQNPGANIWDSPEVMNRLEELGIFNVDEGVLDHPPGPQRHQVPAYMRKAQGEPALKLQDLKRKDTISDLENLRKLSGELGRSPMKESSCNMTPEGQNCPVHGLAECGMAEDLDTDSVMMTKASNMSSESTEFDLARLKKLALT